MKFGVFGLSDIGVSRANNEDVWIACPEVGFFALADGMGGHQAGEVAAKETLEHLSHSVKQIQSSDPWEWTIALRHAIEKANQWVYRLGQSENALSGMGTTLCCLVWAREAVIYAHVGDSRIYRNREGRLELLTQDHSLFAKWLQFKRESHTPFPYKNVITRAVGTAPIANPEIAVCSHQPGDLFFLCTDGLSDVLSLEEIETLINDSPNLEAASKGLIQKAKFKGSSDNITILMVQSEKRIENLSGQQCDDRPRSTGFQGDVARSEWPSRQPL